MNSCPLEQTRLPVLDGLRGLAILFVLIWHFIPCLIKPGIGFGAWAHTINRFLGFTYTGVDLFFVLSGYLIFRLFIKNGVSKTYLWGFYLRRLCRIVPLYFLLLVLFGAFRKLVPEPQNFSWLLNTPMPLWSYVTFLQNWVMGSRGFGAHWLGITWSLSVEEQFYLLAPFLFVLWLKFRSSIVMWFIIFLVVVLRSSESFGFHGFVNTFLRLDSFLLGGVVCVLEGSDQKNRFFFIVPYFFMGTCLLILVKLFIPSFSLWGYWDNNLFFGLFYSSLLACILKPSGFLFMKRCFSTLTLRWLGGISYGLYLFHQMILGLVHGVFFSSAPSLNGHWRLLATGAAFICSIIVAWILNRFIEAPIINLGKNLTRDSRWPRKGHTLSPC